MRILFTFLALYIITSGYAQREKQFVGFFNRTDTRELAYQITKFEKTDIDKVAAIHIWITNNIRYDIDKFSIQDYKRTSLNKILRKRKAICTGYCDVFNELCWQIGVPSTTVNGYAKSADKDVSDSFYLDEHAWNAVKIDKKWYLVDNTWDAGYIRWYKRTFFSKLAQTFSIPYDNFKYAPKFIFDPQQTYYLKSGLYFSTNHLPTNPLWQLTENQISISDFVSDSTNYFREFKDDELLIDFKDKKHIRYAKMNLSEKLIDDGFAGFAFNNKNHFLLSLAYYEQGRMVYDSARKENIRDTSVYNGALKNAMLASQHCDSMAFYLKLQEKQLVENNKEKRKIQKEYSKKYLKYVEKDRRTAEMLSDVMTKSSKKYKELRRDVFDKILEGLEGDDFLEKPFKHRFVDVQDSIDLELKRDSMEELVTNKRKEVEAMIDNYAIQRQYFIDQMVSEIRYLESVENHFNTLVTLRTNGFDDFDYPIKDLKNSLNLTDSFLYVGEDKLVDSLNNAVKITAKAVKEYRKEYSRLTSTYGALKKVQAENETLVQQWKDVREEYVTLMGYAENWFSDVPNIYRISKTGYNRIMKKAKKSKRPIEKEVQLFTPNKAVKQRVKGLLKANKELKKDADRLKKSNQKLINKYTKQ